MNNMNLNKKQISENHFFNFAIIKLDDAGWFMVRNYYYFVLGVQNYEYIF